MCSAAQANYLPEALREEARALGARMAQERIDLVFGGGSVGLMGVLADAVLAGGGKVTGIIPSFLATKEMAHEGITRQVVTRCPTCTARRRRKSASPGRCRPPALRELRKPLLSSTRESKTFLINQLMIDLKLTTEATVPASPE